MTKLADDIDEVLLFLERYGGKPITTKVWEDLYGKNTYLIPESYAITKYLGEESISVVGTWEDRSDAKYSFYFLKYAQDLKVHPSYLKKKLDIEVDSLLK